MFSLENKIALVTGATGGIGRDIAHAMQAAGATVIVTGRSMDKLNAAFDDSFTKIVMDLSKNDAADELFRAAGRVDILINNAGITQDTLIMRMTDEQFDDVINTNLRGTFQMCRAAVKNRVSRIINMASIIGVIGGPGQANYAASKGGMIAMTKSIAAEMGKRGMTANCIAPGFIKTPMTDVLSDELKAAYLAQIPAGRFGEPRDVAAACVFLASDGASYINGQTIHVNGGLGRF
jgi:3-oxoacyl-[acyl-carrier protein] reductase